MVKRLHTVINILCAISVIYKKTKLDRLSRSCIRLFFKNFWRTSILFVRSPIFLFWTSGELCPRLQGLCAMDSSDSPLVLHLQTPWCPAWQPSLFWSTYLYTYRNIGRTLTQPFEPWHALYIIFDENQAYYFRTTSMFSESITYLTWFLHKIFFLVHSSDLW